MRDLYDVVVIGAGLGGLSAACLLVQKKKKVLLLEAHSSVGGCVSYFARKKFLFDAGATTLSGMGHQQPVQRLLRQLNITLPMRLCNPGMVVHQNGKHLERHIDNATWIAACEERFGKQGQESFWTLVHDIAMKGWRASYDSTGLPLQSATDLPKLVRSIQHAALAPYLFRSVEDILKEKGLFANKEFLRFITEQLMITTQSGPADTPFAVGAMGLNYPGDTWYVDGGMNNLARALQKYFVDNGGTLMLRKKVVSVISDQFHTVTTDDRLTFACRSVISNATGWNNRDVFPQLQSYFDKEYSSLAGWGAFTLYAGIEDSFRDYNSLYHQIILDTPLPFINSNSIFLSFSPRDDHSRAPEGFRTLTVSTHVPDPHRWKSLTEHEMSERKSVISHHMLAAINTHFKGFDQAHKPVMMTGTPVTFEHFTHRKYGQVGGIPQSMHRPVILWQGWRTQQKGIYLVGDTVYPGQGAPGVILGALNLVEGMKMK
ncbi:MAG: phytoene desaturase family protein [Bacteroidota bacterium]